MNDRPSLGARLLSPACLALALLSLFCAFALLAKGSPEANMELHQARLGTNQEQKARLEGRLHRHQWVRRAMIGGLFSTSTAFFVAGFLTLNPTRSDE